MNSSDHHDSDPLPTDHLDPLLRAWHEQNAARAAQLRDATLARVAAESSAPRALRFPRVLGLTLPRSLATAAVLALAIAGAFLLPIFPSKDAYAAGGTFMVAEGGSLNACDRSGQVIGACPLKHTDVKVDIAGPFTRVTLTQKFQNPYRVPIEAVYTFPLGERSAVDRMRMVVHGPTGERVVEGIVKERSMARFIYEAARNEGFVASLLEQERPNIFTQSVANIEPGSTVDVEISYIETLAMQDGTYQFAFPMVVTPRYIPGQSANTAPLPAGWTPRDGVILLGPAKLTITADAAAPAPVTILDPNVAAIVVVNPTAPPSTPPSSTADAVLAMQLDTARAVQSPSQEQLSALGEPTQKFSATYPDGSQEPGALYKSGAGSIGGRWFLLAVDSSPSGSGFAANNAKVPDASRITPMPVRPDTRAGHDISLAVNIDSGGPDLRDVVSQLHGIAVKWDGNSRCALTLQGGNTIPNKDFVLNWGLKGASVLEGVFSSSDANGGFVTVVMNPPPPSTKPAALPRELVFVMDTSGSMKGRPFEKSKEVMRSALAAMRPEDSFNVVTFAGSTAVLWPEVRPATKDNVEIALKFVEGRQSGGGTEMMKALDAALVQMPGLAPVAQPDGSVVVPPRTPVSPGQAPADLAGGDDPGSGESKRGSARGLPPMRVAIFLTDGEVGNDQGIIDAVEKNAGTTRVFTFGIGNSINRYLLEEMARRGRGACDIVLTSDNADKAVELFVRRMQTPVLQDITVSFEGVEVADLLPSGRLLPDLFDVQPLIVHGRWKAPGTGTVVVRGRTAEGPYERSIPVMLKAGDEKTAMLPKLWARSKVDQVLETHLLQVEQQTLPREIRQEVVGIGETFQIVTPYTSFVAVERSRMIVGGKPMRVTVPIEFPEGLQWDGFFGSASWCNDAVVAAALAAEGAELLDGLSELAEAQTGSVGGYIAAPSTGPTGIWLDDAGPTVTTLESATRRDSLGAQAQREGYGFQLPGTGGARLGEKESRLRLRTLDASTVRSFSVVAGQSPASPAVPTGSPGHAPPVSAGTNVNFFVEGAAVKKVEDQPRKSAAPGAAPAPQSPSAPPPPPPPVVNPAQEPKPGAAAPQPSNTAPAEVAPPAMMQPPAPPAPSAPSAPPKPAPAADPALSKPAPAAPMPVPAPDSAVPMAAEPESTQLRREFLKDSGARESERLDAFYIVKAGDTLSSISQATYGSAQEWKSILEANATLLNGNERGLQPGMKLMIPPLAAPQAAKAEAAAPSKEIGPEARQRLMRILEQRLLALALYARLDADVRGKLEPLPQEVSGLALPTAPNAAAVPTAPVTPPTASSTKEAAVPGALPVSDFSQSLVKVSLLIAADTKEVRALLEGVGFTRAGAGSAPNGKVILLGEVPVNRLIDLAMLQEVLRIEPQDLKEIAAAPTR